MFGVAATSKVVKVSQLQPRNRHVILLTAAAVGSSLCQITNAFSPAAPSRRGISNHRTWLPSSLTRYAPECGGNQCFSQSAAASSSSFRLYSSSSGGGDDSLVGKAKKFAKTKLNPRYWLMSPREREDYVERLEEKEKLSLRKQEYRDEMRSLLKDAPTGLRILGELVTPLISNVMGALSEQMEDQRGQIDALLSEAQRAIVMDPAATRLLGEPISVGAPFSQSSSTTSINGKTSSQVQVSCPVQGSMASGTVSLAANDGSIISLVLQVGRSRVSINPNPRGPASRGGVASAKEGRLGQNSPSSFDRDNVIDVDFVEKNKEP